MSGILTLLAADCFVLEELWLSLEHYEQRLAAADQALREFARRESQDSYEWHCRYIFGL